jgi:hypothetical protein
MSALHQKRMAGFFVIVIALVTYFAYFSNSRDMGLQSDDAAIAAVIPQNWAQYKAQVLDSGTEWGRPIGNFIATTAGYIGTLLGLEGTALYGLSFVCNFVYFCLFFIVAKEVFDFNIAVTCTILFVLYPADSSKYQLAHACSTHASGMFTLIALLLYCRGWWMLGAGLGASTVLIYENNLLNLFFLSLAISFTRGMTTGSLLNWARFSGLYVLLTATIVAHRLSFRPGRLSVLGTFPVPELIERMLIAQVYGPIASVASFYLRPATLLRQGDAEVLIRVLLTFLALGAVVWAAATVAPATPRRGRAHAWACASVTALIAFVTSYAYFVHDRFPPLYINGRLSGVHAAGAIALCMAFGSALQGGVGSSPNGPNPRRYATAGLLLACTAVCAVYLSFFAWYQDRVRQINAIQVAFMDRLDKELGPATEPRLVFLQNEYIIPETRWEVVFDWAFGHMARQIAPPTLRKDLFFVVSHVAWTAEVQDGWVIVDRYPGLGVETFPPERMIVVNLDPSLPRTAVVLRNGQVLPHQQRQLDLRALRQDVCRLVTCVPP